MNILCRRILTYTASRLIEEERSQCIEWQIHSPNPRVPEAVHSHMWESLVHENSGPRIRKCEETLPKLVRRLGPSGEQNVEEVIRRCQESISIPRIHGQEVIFENFQWRSVEEFKGVTALWPAWVLWQTRDAPLSLSSTDLSMTLKIPRYNVRHCSVAEL